ncbi:MAG: type II secretion system F family protein [candidate division Zixibacteria bacterium]|nr:type II secretion system F family protein [candidate division Zixibacteria bacterium]
MSTEGLLVLELSPAASLPAGASLAHREYSQVVKFTRQLAAMLRSGMRLDAALHVLLRQDHSHRWHRLLTSIAAGLQEGRMLADALAEHPQVFNPVYINLVRSGETAGDLPGVLTRLARSLDSTDRIKRKLRAALAYPIVILAIAVIVLFILLAYIVPVFKEMFMSFQSELPPLTEIVVGLSDALTQYPTYVLGALGIFAITGILLVRSNWASQVASNVPLLIPGLHSIVIKSETANFARTVATLLDGGVALHEAMPLAAATVRSERLRSELGSATHLIASGGQLHDAWRNSTIVPPMLTEMAAVGEETGTLSRMFDTLADYYSEELETIIPSITAILEPLLIVLVGIVVAAILISMYLPLFELIGQLG